MINPSEAFDPTAETPATAAPKPATNQQKNPIRSNLLKNARSELQLATNRRHNFTGQVLLLELEERPLCEASAKGAI
jgi:hypothetical protein